jgi:hypothetical protein
VGSAAMMIGTMMRVTPVKTGGQPMTQALNPTLAAIVRERTGATWSRAKQLCIDGRVTVDGERILRSHGARPARLRGCRR